MLECCHATTVCPRSMDHSSLDNAVCRFADDHSWDCQIGQIGSEDEPKRPTSEGNVTSSLTEMHAGLG